jgi:hypothetical protein
MIFFLQVDPPASGERLGRQRALQKEKSEQ